MLEISNHCISRKVTASIIVFKKEKISKPASSIIVFKKQKTSKPASYIDAENVRRRKEFKVNFEPFGYGL